MNVLFISFVDRNSFCKNKYSYGTAGSSHSHIIIYRKCDAPNKKNREQYDGIPFSNSKNIVYFRIDV